MKTENVVAVRGIVHRLYQDILYCQYAIHFHGKVKVKQSRYMPGVAQRVPGS